MCIRRNSDTCTVTYSNEIDDIEYEFQIINVDSGNEMIIINRLCFNKKKL